LSTAATAGNWAYTHIYRFYRERFLGRSVGHYSQDAAGNVTGSQTRSAAGNPE
jgi:hypothetical protein